MRGLNDRWLAVAVRVRIDALVRTGACGMLRTYLGLGPWKMVPAAVHYTVAVHAAAVLRVVTCDQCWADVRGTGEFNGGVKVEYTRKRNRG